MATKGLAPIQLSLLLLVLTYARQGCSAEENKVTVPYNHVGKDFLIYWQRYNILILFYVPWCEYSSAVDPVFYEMAKAFQNTSINVAKSDVSEYGDVAKFFKVSETPTIKFLKQGLIYNFDGTPTIENLLAFVSRVLSPEIRTINTTDQLNAWKGNFSVLFMLLQPEKINPEWQSIYKQVAKERVVQSVFLFTNNQDIVGSFGVKHTPTLLVLKDSTHYEYKESLSSHSMGAWADSEKFPSFPQVNYSTARPYLIHLSPGKKVAIFSTPQGELSAVNSKYLHVVRTIALERNFQRGYQFVWNVGEELPSRLTQQPAVLPSLIVWDPTTNYYYRFNEVMTPDTFTKKTVAQFVLSVSKGDLQPQGGVKISDRIAYFIAFVYGVIQAMIIHKPILSLAGVALLLTGIVIFCHAKYTRNSGSASRTPKKYKKPKGRRNVREANLSPTYGNGSGNSDEVNRNETRDQPLAGNETGSSSVRLRNVGDATS